MLFFVTVLKKKKKKASRIPEKKKLHEKRLDGIIKNDQHMAERNTRKLKCNSTANLKLPS